MSIAIGVAAGIFLGAGVRALFSSRFSVQHRVNPLDLSRIAERIDALLNAANISCDPFAGLPDPIREAIQNDRKIEAIRLYRAESGAGLSEAKEYIEDIMSPERQIQRKLDALGQNAGIPYDRFINVPAPVLDAIRMRNTVEATILYRQSTGAGLKDAEKQVEDIRRQVAWHESAAARDRNPR